LVTLHCFFDALKDGVTVLGVEFFRGTADDAVERILEGGLLVAPSGPGLSKNLIEDLWYGEALDAADIVLPDSGLMVLIWNWIACRGKSRIKRVSGLEFLNCFLCAPAVKSKLHQSFWIMPSIEENLVNLQWLRKDLDIDVPVEATYIAPIYRSTGEIQDDLLLKNIRERTPSIIFLNIGGGVQERVGHYLKDNLDPCPAILCCGAAIAFLAGGQARIPDWADRWMLGWLLRCLHNPTGFVPRYWQARTLVPLILRYRDQRPLLQDVPMEPA
jgi:N-acetylglucosaminyldiphosphoundecaprenol N-acetyl-beta-D-mannosaminyltransferase